MTSLTLAFAAQSLGVSLNGLDAVINDVQTDSRAVSNGSLFVAIKGATVNGHDFIAEAQKNGAIGVIVSEPVQTTLPTLQVSNTVLALGQLAKAYRQQFQPRIVAITGSCGKTTVRGMVTSILNQVGPTLSAEGNLNTDIGVPLTLLRLKKEHEYAVIEMGAKRAGDIAYLMEVVNPDVSVITNVGVAHQEIFGGKEAIAQAKGEIFVHLKAGGMAVLNKDDAFVEYWISLLKPSQKKSFFSMQKDTSAVFPSNIHYEATSSQFTLHTDAGEITINLTVPGQAMVQNAVTAATLARALNIPLSHIQNGLKAFKAVSGRLEFKKGLNNALIIDDTYNANPVSMRAALNVLAKLPGQRIFVMGDMGELGVETEILHTGIGEEAKQLGIDCLLACGNLTRFSVNGFGDLATHYPDKNSLINALKQMINQDSVVLVKGSRFMKMEEIVTALSPA